MEDLYEDYPELACNHTKKTQNISFGYRSGILDEGMPYEVELYMVDDMLQMSIVLPLIEEFHDDNEEFPCDDDGEFTVIKEYVGEDYDCNLLVGKFRGNRQISFDAMLNYVNLLMEEEMFCFLDGNSNNGAASYVDDDDNEVVEITVTLHDGYEVVAETDIVFEPLASSLYEQMGYESITFVADDCCVYGTKKVYSDNEQNFEMMEDVLLELECDE